VNANLDRHARQQTLKWRLVGIKLDPHRNALDDLREIAGGVIRRQQRELRAARRCDPLDIATQLLVRTITAKNGIANRARALRTLIGAAVCRPDGGGSDARAAANLGGAVGTI
jgi:hypothetical protein